MAMKRCPVCGEKYSDTYAECPFCEEEKAFQDGEQIRRGGGHGGRRAAGRQQMNLITPTLIVLILIMAGLLVYLLWGDKIADSFQSKEETQTPPVEELQPEEEQPAADGDGEEDGESEPGVMPGGTEEPDETQTEETPETDGELTYETASALPDGLTLSTTDFTLRSVGESHTITASGGSSTYTWISEDEGIASVDSNGKVTAISQGTVNVLVTDGTKKGVCIVRCNVGTQSGSSTSSTTSSSGSGTTSSSGLKTGAAVVVNGGNGVFVRSGPGTSYEALATIPNGAEVKILESAGDGWYKISFAGTGGASTTGYMKGDFLSNG